MLDALRWTQEHMKEMRRKEVIIIAGPSASGKSYLMRQLTTKKKNDFKDKIYRELGINSHKPRSSISIGALKNLDKKPEHLRKLKKKVIFIHYYLTSRHQEDKIQLLISIAKYCKKIKVLTIRTSFKTWRERMKKRDEESSTNTPRNIATTIYKTSQFNLFLAKWQYELVYRKWSNFLTKINPDKALTFKN